MNDSDLKSIKELLSAYARGQRKFDNWDFHENISAQGIDLTGAVFKNCFLFTDFRNTNLTRVQFINCNLKTANFKGANLESALIKNCSVESTIFTGAKTQNFRFENNYCYGAIVDLKDFDEVFKNEPES